MRSLNSLLWLRKIALDLRRKWINLVKGVDIHPGAQVSLAARLVSGRRGSITVEDGTLVAFKTLLIARESDGTVKPIHIGRNCFIGGGSVILPGVNVADNCVIGAGAVVFESVPARCIAAGNPARIIRQDIKVSRYGRFDYADANETISRSKDRHQEAS